MDTNELPWVDSPLPGVQRRMLDRDGDEVARATSIVRYAPGSYFHEHSHNGGEEFLVLDGVFSDEMGDFPAGMYVRNPIDSKHKPFTKDGTTILVKLMQFEADDRSFVRIDTKNETWQSSNVDGLMVMPLHEHKTEKVSLIKLEPGTHLKQHSHFGGEEFFVLSGAIADENGCYSEETWVRYPDGSQHTPYSENGCLLFIKTGHLL